MLLAPDETLAALYRDDRAAHPPGRRARLQPRPRHPLRPHRAARRPRRLPGRAQGAGNGAALALQGGQGHGRAVGGRAGCQRQGRGARARLRPRDRLRPRRAPRLELRRGMRGRPVQRAGGGVGRGAGNPDRRLRHAGRGRRQRGSRLYGMRRRTEADRRADRSARHRRDARGDQQHRRTGRGARRAADRR